MKNQVLFALLLSCILFQGCKTLDIKQNNSVLERIDGIVRDKNEKIPSTKKLDCDYYFIYYGADWCPDCKKEQESLKNFYKTYKKNIETLK